MRIIENNYQDKEQEYEITCPHCRSKIAYTFGDVVSDSFNDDWIYCPVCDKEISIYDSETPTIETMQYPKDFYSFENAVPIFVFAYKSDEDLPAATVIVAQKYQETDVKISRKNF